MEARSAKVVAFVVIYTALLAVVVGCAGVTREVPVGEESQAGVAGFLLLADGTIRGGAGGPPAGLHVRGRILGDRFVPEGNVEGGGELGASGHPGWMELADGSFHGDQTGRAPFPPYVHGFLGDDGVFRPDTRTVVY